MSIVGARHVDIYARTDKVMFIREDRTDSGCIYVGITPKFGESSSNSKWQISRTTFDGTDLITTFANDGKYNCVWDDRGTYFAPCPVPTVPIPGLSGEFTVSLKGLNIGGRVTDVVLPAGVWTKIPTTPLADRNAISIQNYSGNDIKINYDLDGVPTDGYPANYKGVIIADSSERYYDITDNVEIYAMPDIAAGSLSITVEELS